MNLNGNYPVINGGINPSGYIEQYNEDLDTITISQGGASAGYVAWQKKKFWAGAHCYIVKPISENLSNRYLYFFLKNQESYLQQMQQGAGIPALKREKVQTLQIPIPSLAEQERIVSILDKFESLVTDLSQGLPAEITARQQQYEYYRDKLLSFPKLTA